MSVPPDLRSSFAKPVTASRPVGFRTRESSSPPRACLPDTESSCLSWPRDSRQRTRRSTAQVSSARLLIIHRSCPPNAQSSWINTRAGEGKGDIQLDRVKHEEPTPRRVLRGEFKIARYSPPGYLSEVPPSKKLTECARQKICQSMVHHQHVHTNALDQPKSGSERDFSPKLKTTETVSFSDAGPRAERWRLDESLMTIVTNTDLVQSLSSTVGSTAGQVAFLSQSVE